MDRAAAAKIVLRSVMADELAQREKAAGERAVASVGRYGSSCHRLIIRKKKDTIDRGGRITCCSSAERVDSKRSRLSPMLSRVKFSLLNSNLRAHAIYINHDHL